MSGTSFGRASVSSAAVVAVLFVATIGASSAWAEFLYTSQSRYVEASAGPSQQYTAANFGPFSATAYRQYITQFEGSSYARAIQTSSLTPTSITAEGSAYAWGNFGFVGSRADNVFDVSFGVSVPAAYVFSLGGQMFDFEISGPGLITPLPSTGVLLPGNYTLSIHAYSEYYGGNSWGSDYSFSLTIPEPSGIFALAAVGLFLKRHG